MALQSSLFKCIGGNKIKVNQKILLEIKRNTNLKENGDLVDSWKSEFVGLSDCDTGMVCTVC